MKDIKGYEGIYAITSCGRVWSYKRRIFLKQKRDQQGYLRVNLYKNGKQTTYRIHRLVAEAYIPNPDNKPTVDHINQDKTNNCINNLRWATMAEQNKNHPNCIKR